MAGLTRVIFGLGSNLGDRYQHLSDAVETLRVRIGVLEKISDLYETPPMGFEADQDFLNLCLSILTPLSAQEILQITKEIEAKTGRTWSSEGYSSRPLDIDMIFFGDEIIEQDELIIPHPRFKDRLFVLKPLTDLDVNFIDPSSQKSVGQLLSESIDKSQLTVYEKQIKLYD
ncbi:MAG: 2-amino-4-hydroxy-6-hydroxymethyldihydropteridine diphosphokinase [Crocinitomicaceae bacterium]|nr:2-amino-4-hydroxy-6-hydroxymethyldihydropteridine diphosphokinase [Crocinitomicaceae bacterium]